MKQNWPWSWNSRSRSILRQVLYYISSSNRRWRRTNFSFHPVHLYWNLHPITSRAINSVRSELGSLERGLDLLALPVVCLTRRSLRRRRPPVEGPAHFSTRSPLEASAWLCPCRRCLDWCSANRHASNSDKQRETDARNHKYSREKIFHKCEKSGGNLRWFESVL